MSAHDRAPLRRTQEVHPRAGGGDAVRHLHPARHPEERVRRRSGNGGDLRGWHACERAAADQAPERRGSAMPTNRNRPVVPISMGGGGFEVLKTRDDVEVIPFPPMISSPDFNALLRADGEVNGAILGLTRFGETEAQNAKGLQVVSRIGVGYDTVDVPALTRPKLPLI